MTIQEASERYMIPIKILKEYESWGLCGAVKKVMGAWQYDDTEEVETYMRLLLEQKDSDMARLRMLNQKRSTTLDEIHFRERQLERLDYLRHELRKKTEGQKE